MLVLVLVYAVLSAGMSTEGSLPMFPQPYVPTFLRFVRVRVKASLNITLNFKGNVGTQDLILKMS